MNEAETRAEHIDPALKAAGWGVVEGSRIRREYPIAPGRIEGHGRRGNPWFNAPAVFKSLFVCLASSAVKFRPFFPNRATVPTRINIGQTQCFQPCQSHCTARFKNAKTLENIGLARWHG